MCWLQRVVFLHQLGSESLYLSSTKTDKGIALKNGLAVLVCPLLSHSYFWYKPEASLRPNWVVVAFCMSVSHCPAESNISPCLLILTLKRKCVWPPFCVSPFCPFLPCMWGYACVHEYVCHCSCILSKYVPVIVFSGVWLCKACVRAQVNACVLISVCNYIDSQGNCPPPPTTKRILILSGLTVPPEEGGGNQLSMEDD